MSGYQVRNKELKNKLEELFEYCRLQRFLERQDDLVSTIMVAVDRLHPREKTLITARYLEADYVRDYEVYRDLMQISKDTFTRIRSAAFFKLAALLNVDSLTKQAAERVKDIAG